MRVPETFVHLSTFSKYVLLAADLKLAKETSEALATAALPRDLDHCISLVQPWVDGIERAYHPFKRPWNVLKTIILMRGRRVLPCGSPSSARLNSSYGAVP